MKTFQFIKYVILTVCGIIVIAETGNAFWPDAPTLVQFCSGGLLAGVVWELTMKN